MTNAETFSGLQAPIKAAYLTYKASTYNLQTLLIAATDAQAVLEKNYLEAYYLKQYWGELKSNLNTSGGGYSYPRSYKTARDTIADASDADNSTEAGAEQLANAADTALTQAEEALADLLATQAETAAVVAELGKRLVRSHREIAELLALAADDGQSGTLDKAAALRLLDYTTHTEGEVADALAAFNAADDATKARTAADQTDGGELTEDQLVALKAW